MPRIAVVTLAMTLCASNVAGECVGMTFEQSAKFFPIVLAGKAISSGDRALANGRGMVSDTTFQVERVWKGDVPKQINLYQRVTADSIDFADVIGVEYIVFAKPLTADERISYSVPPDVAAFDVNFCLSQPASKGNVMGKSYPPSK